MKLNIDFFSTIKGEMLATKKFKNRLKRYWGTELVDGVEVFQKYFYLYPRDLNSKEASTILKMFGAWNSVKGTDFGSVASYYLYLNSDKWTGQSEFVWDVLIDKMEGFIPIGQKFDVNINFTESTEDNRYAGYTKEQLLEYVDNNYDSIVDSMWIEARSSTMSMEAIGKYVLLDDSTIFDVKVVDCRVMPKFVKGSNEDSLGRMEADRYVTTLSLQLEVTRKASIYEESEFIKGIKRETSEAENRKLRELQDADQDETGGWFGRYRPGRTDDFWYKGQLRVETANSQYLHRNKFMELFTKSIDTGYTQKKTKWWKEILGVVILFVAILLAVPTGGASLSLATLALYVGIALIVMTAIQYSMARDGDVAGAEYMGKWIKVGQVISITAGIASIIQNMAKNGVMNALMSQGAAQGGTQLTQTTILEATTAGMSTELGTVVGNEVAVTTTTTAGTSYLNLMSKAAQVLDWIVNAREKMKVEKFESERQDLMEGVRQSEDELARMYDKEIHIGVEDIKMYTNPLKMENLQFEVDYLYEGTKYNIGRPSFVPTGLNEIS